jgi:hypothetical protein
MPACAEVTGPHYRGYRYSEFRSLSLQHNPTLARCIVEQMDTLDQLLKAMRCCEMLRQMVLRTPSLRARLLEHLQVRWTSLTTRSASKGSVCSVTDNPHARLLTLSAATQRGTGQWRSVTVLRTRGAETLLDLLVTASDAFATSSTLSVQISAPLCPFELDRSGLVQTADLLPHFQCCLVPQLTLALDIPLSEWCAVVVQLESTVPFEAQATLHWP